MKKDYRMTDPRLTAICFRANKKEYEVILQQFKNSTFSRLAQFTRAKVLGRTINVKYRNASVDDFLMEMIPLKKALFKLIEDVKQSNNGWKPDQQKILIEKIDLVIEKLINIFNICSRV
ncbi:MAG: hypothetical protein Q8932_21450 [Bacteroidota bacterium]|nr:hypothetical protein [Bacteroidota bacterium]MDP4256285.1 hypothetical protein [Bacteroidota bacterium]